MMGWGRRVALVVIQRSQSSVGASADEAHEFVDGGRFLMSCTRLACMVFVSLSAAGCKEFINAMNDQAEQNRLVTVTIIGSHQSNESRRPRLG